MTNPDYWASGIEYILR